MQRVGVAFSELQPACFAPKKLVFIKFSAKLYNSSDFCSSSEKQSTHLKQVWPEKWRRNHDEHTIDEHTIKVGRIRKENRNCSNLRRTLLFCGNAESPSRGWTDVPVPGRKGRVEAAGRHRRPRLLQPPGK